MFYWLFRNNMTILEVLRMSGRGASAQFRFGHRKPGSTTPLLFELTDKHLKDCERMYVSSFSPHNLGKKVCIFSHAQFIYLVTTPIKHVLQSTFVALRIFLNDFFIFILIIIIERKRFSL